MKLWGGRFAKDADAAVEAFTESISFDRRLYREDIRGSIAHCRMLARQGIIPQADAEAIEHGLQDVLRDFDAGRIETPLSIEDIHTAVESALRTKIGDAAGKLHTARSRNDQIALDLRMYQKTVILEALERMHALQETLLNLAEQHNSDIMPGYTHVQRAQPVVLGHHFLAYFEMADRDAGRLRDCYARTNVMPLGSGALAGSPYPLDREAVARDLGFPAITRNSMDAVSDRDFVVEFLAAAALCMAHLSRLCEELVLWSSTEYRFVEIDDSFATGSSIMPQKKNPDVAELVRGKTGRVYGSLVAMLTILKGLPLTYNRDLQEDKEQLFDAADTLIGALSLMAPMLATARFNTKRMLSAAGENFSLATDLADYLVGKGVPFREAHGIIGRLVVACLDRGCDWTDLSLAELKQYSPRFDEDVMSITVESSVGARDVPGGTAPRRVIEAIEMGRGVLADGSRWLAAQTSSPGS